MKESLELEFSQMLERYQSQKIQTLEFIAWAKDWLPSCLENWPEESIHLQKNYANVWLDLMDRFESSAMFTQESCSFSQNELLHLMTQWVKKVNNLSGPKRNS
jgi:hypothetical protein